MPLDESTLLEAGRILWPAFQERIKATAPPQTNGVHPTPAKPVTFSDSPPDDDSDTPQGFSASDIANLTDYFSPDADGAYPGHLHTTFKMGIKAFADAAKLRRRGMMSADGKLCWSWVPREAKKEEPKAFAAESTPSPPDDSATHDAISQAMIDYAFECSEHGVNPAEGIERLRAMIDDPHAMERLTGADDSASFSDADLATFAAHKDGDRWTTGNREYTRSGGRTTWKSTLKHDDNRKAKEQRATTRVEKADKKAAAANVVKKLTAEGNLKGKVTPEDLHDLADAIGSGHVSVAELRGIKNALRGAAVNAGFGGEKRKEGMIAALVNHARGEAFNRRLDEQGIVGNDAEEMKRVAGLGKETPAAEPTSPKEEEPAKESPAPANTPTTDIAPSPTTEDIAATTPEEKNVEGNPLPGRIPDARDIANATKTPIKTEGGATGGSAKDLYTIEHGGKKYAVKSAEKSSAVGDKDAANRVQAEVLSGELAKAAGVAVPEAKAMDIAGKPHVVSQWADGTPLSTGGEAALKSVRPGEISKMALFDFATGHTDSHLGNYLVGKDGTLHGIDRESSLGGDTTAKDMGFHLDENKLLRTAAGGSDAKMRAMVLPQDQVKHMASVAATIPGKLQGKAAEAASERAAVLSKLAELTNPTVGDLMRLSDEHGSSKPAEVGVATSPHNADAAHAEGGRVAQQLTHIGIIPGRPVPVSEAVRKLATSEEQDSGNLGPALDRLNAAVDAGYATVADGQFDLRSSPEYGPHDPAVADKVRGAFDKLSDSNNFVGLHKIREALPDVPLKQLHAAAQHLRKTGEFGLSSDERYDGISPEKQAASIRENGENLLHMSRKKPATTTDPALDMVGLLDQPADAVDPGSRTGEAVARKEKQQAKRAGVKTSPLAKPPSWATPEISPTIAAHSNATGKQREFLENAMDRAGMLNVDNKTGAVKGYEKTIPDDAHSRLAQELAISHRDAHDAGHPSEHIESALHGLGAEKIGETGEPTKFNGSIHEGPAGSFTGHDVNVTRPGWVHGEKVLNKAKVEKSGKSPENTSTGLDKKQGVGDTTSVEPGKSSGDEKRNTTMTKEELGSKSRAQLESHYASHVDTSGLKNPRKVALSSFAGIINAAAKPDAKPGSKVPANSDDRTLFVRQAVTHGLEAGLNPSAIGDSLVSIGVPHADVAKELASSPDEEEYTPEGLAKVQEGVKKWASSPTSVEQPKSGGGKPEGSKVESSPKNILDEVSGLAHSAIHPEVKKAIDAAKVQMVHAGFSPDEQRDWAYNQLVYRHDMMSNPEAKKEIRSITNRLFPGKPQIEDPDAVWQRIQSVKDAIKASKINASIDRDNSGRVFINTRNPSTGNTTVTPVDDHSAAGIAKAIAEHKKVTKSRDAASVSRKRAEQNND